MSKLGEGNKGRNVATVLNRCLSAPETFLRPTFHDCQVQVRDDFFKELWYQKAGKDWPHKVGFGRTADIIVLAARESVSFSGVPHTEIPLGIKDSRTSSVKEADAELPSAAVPVDDIISTFMSEILNIEESVAILGAHTHGVGPCINTVRRLYHPQPGYNVDLEFEALLRLTCAIEIPIANLTFVPNDMTPTIFDNHYYRDILSGKGKFGIDPSISRDPRIAPLVTQFAMVQDYFFKVFSSAFVKRSSTNSAG